MSAHAHGHSHGLVDRSITRSRAGLRAVGISLAVLLATALAQAAIFVATGSVALLADLIHNFGDALTAIPLGDRLPAALGVAEKRAGYFVVAAIFVSACVAAVEAVDRLINPQRARPPAGARRWPARSASPATRSPRRSAARRPPPREPGAVADGYHARTDGFVSLAVVASAVVVALGLDRRPAHRPVITLVILRITWQSWQTVRGHHHAHG